jgi:hypothetical protein
MFHRRLILPLVLLLGAAPSVVHASSLSVQTLSFGGIVDSIGATRFDPTLGTLDSVGVTINGVLTASGPALPAAGTAGPYLFAVSVEQRFGVSAAELFDFGSPAQFRLDGVSAAAGQPFTLVVPFTYTFTFTSLSDILGFVLPAFSGPTVPPVTVNGRRADFVGDPTVPGFITLTHVGTGVAVTGPVPVVTSVSSQGAMILEYRYTPTDPSVPEPATALLLAGGLWVVVRRRRAA